MTSIQDIRIRLAEAADAAAIASLLSESFIEYRHLYTLAGYAATAISSEQVMDRIGEGPVWVGVRDQMIVGTVSVVPKGESLYIRGMAVRPKARGRRIGELLLMHIEKFALSRGVQRLFLSTTPFLDRAIRLYEKFGFRRTETGSTELFGTPLFTMEKVIG